MNPPRPITSFITLAGLAAGAIVILSISQSAAAQKQKPISQTQERNGTWNTIEVPVHMPKVNFNLTPAKIAASAGSSTDGGCKAEMVTYSSHNFSTSGFIVEAGFVAQEIAAVTYTIPAINFPIRIDRVDGLFGTLNPQSQITTRWSLIVWEGQPNTGTIVYTIISDGLNPPHMILSPPTNGIVVQASVDPNDPDQIVVGNSLGTNKFTVGFRIDQMNNPPTSNCACNMPAACCAHNQGTNIFPTVDTSGLSQPGQNWLFARSGCGVCAAPTGWYTSAQVGISGDWNIRALFTPSGCVAQTGACCLQSGSCLDGLTVGECAAQSGTYQGNDTTCASINCPVPQGACCLPNDQCTSLTFNQCQSQGGTYLGNDVFCTSGSCRGACCLPSNHTCVFTTQTNCLGVGGVFRGLGTTCATAACFGACCLPNGSCAGNLLPENCASQGGIYQGNNSTCAGVNCPQPVGACCFFDFCLVDETEADCINGFGGVWQGPQSTCAPIDPCAPPAPCPADISPAAGDGVVNVNDLLAVINGWGPCAAPCANCQPDITNDCTTNVNDLLAVINSWGSCN